MTNRAQNLYSYLKDDGVVFPIKKSLALKYRGVGYAVVKEWTELGLVIREECCADWLAQIEKVNGPIVLQALRSGNPNQFDGIPFRYCPWCGKARKK